MTPEEAAQVALYDHAKWVEENYGILSTIHAVADEAMRHASVVQSASADPNGRRVAALRGRVARLHQVIQTLDLPPNASASPTSPNSRTAQTGQ